MAAIARTINSCGQTETPGNDRDLRKSLDGDTEVRDFVENFHFSDVGLNAYTIKGLRISSVSVIVYLPIIQLFRENGGLGLGRETDTDDRFHLQVFGETKEFLDIFFGCLSAGMSPIPDLNPAASKP
jgi:hypothetical protein